MSYLKVNKNNLSLIKDELNNCYTSIENSITNISNNVPTKRDLSIDLEEYNNQEGTDYTKVGTEYNNSIDAINDNVTNSTILRDLKSIIDDIGSIIKSVDDFNLTDYSTYENKIAKLFDELLFLDTTDTNTTELKKVEGYAS